MPTLDPPVLETGDDSAPPRHRRLAHWHPAALAIVAFVTALATTVLVVVVAGALRN